MRVPRTVFRERKGGLEPEGERTAVSLAISTVARDAVESYLDRRSRWFKIGAAVVLLGVFVDMFFALPMLALGADIGLFLLVNGPIVLGAVCIGGLLFYYGASKTPDLEIESVEKGYWSTYLVPSTDGTVVFDATDQVPQSEFTLERLRDTGRISRAHETLSDIGELPTMMPRDESVERDIVSTIDDAHHVLESADERTLHVPLLDRTDDTVDTIAALRSHATESPVNVAAVRWDIDEARSDIEAMFELQQLAREESEGVDLESVTETGTDVVDRVSGTHDSSVGVLSDHLETAGDLFALSTYNFYCPICRFDDIESRLDAVDSEDAEGVKWSCETCGNQFDQELVIPRHAIRDSLVDDIWDQLWIEKDDQRREIYENIDDQHHELREREFEQAREEIRTAMDRIRDLQARVRDLKTDARAGEGKVDEIGDLMVEYERLNESKKRSFQNEVQQTYQRIDREVEENIEEMQELREERIEAAQQEAKEKAEAIREEERHEEWERFMLGQQLADERTRARLDAEDRGHQLMASGLRDVMDQQESMHKEEILLDTEGELSRFGVVNEARWQWGKVTGRSKNGVK